MSTSEDIFFRDVASCTINTFSKTEISVIQQLILFAMIYYKAVTSQLKADCRSDRALYE